MQRRDFIRSIECLTAGALCAPLVLGGCSGVRHISAAMEGDRLVVRRADLAAHPFALVQHPSLSRAVYLHRNPEGTYTAVLTRCTHRGCQVEPAGDRLACPCHGSQYSLTGEVLKGPAERALQRFPVTENAEAIYIHLSNTP